VLISHERWWPDMTALLTAQEASLSLRAFVREHRENGEKLSDLASHAAMPTVLSTELVHLLRINYFLDPPLNLPFEAEAALLLSSLCTEIDDGLYVIDPTLRDLLLKQLIARHGSTRVRDVARLLWEYNGRGTPWADRPGLLEAQQLTALNFIDPERAQAWLARARRGEGTLPVDDERWFVALERDLLARTAALSAEPTSLTERLPAMRELWDAVVAVAPGDAAVLRIAQNLGISLPVPLEQMGPASRWRTLLDKSWSLNRIPDLLDLISKELGQAKGWTRAVHEFWIKLAAALRIVNGRFETPPPEWQILEQHRPALEKAIRSTVLLVVESPSSEPQIFGLGTLVGDHVVITHSSMLHDVLALGFGLNGPSKVFAELTEDHAAFGYVPGLKRRLELSHAVVHQTTQFVVLAAKSGSDFSAFPDPLSVMTQASLPTKGREVCIVGYPMSDSRVDPQVLARVLAGDYGRFRLMPGQIIDEDTQRGILVHNCFTTSGTGGSPLIDIETGAVLGVHFAAKYDPTSLGLKEGHAISTLHLLNDPSIANTGMFAVPTHRPTPGPITRRLPAFSEKGFLQSLEQREKLLLVQGPKKSGKSTVLFKMSRIAKEHGFRTLFISGSDFKGQRSSSHLVMDIAKTLGLNLEPPQWNESIATWIQSFVPLIEQLHLQPTVLFFDDFEFTHGMVLDLGVVLFHLRNEFQMFVVAGEQVDQLVVPKIDVVNLIELERSDSQPEIPAVQLSTGRFGVLVVGTGWFDLPQSVQLAAQYVGDAIAKAGCTLVTGGWPGVDHLAARGFSEAIGPDDPHLPNRLIQVLEGDQQADFKGNSTIVHVPHNLRSTVALKSADVAVFIGGAGGTWEAFRSALASQKLVIPFFNTGTDARRAAILLEIFGERVPTRFLRAEFDDEGKARQAGQLLESVLNHLDPGPASYLDNRDLLWMTDIVLPLGEEYLRQSSGFEDKADRILMECTAHDLSIATYDKMVTTFLEESEPAWRCVAYLAIQAKPRDTFVKPLVSNGAKEVALALDQRETRPLWRWLMAISKSLDGHPDSFPSGLSGSLQSTARAIAARSDVDPGGECKNLINAILSKLAMANLQGQVTSQSADLSSALRSWGKTAENRIFEQLRGLGASAIPNLEEALNDANAEIRGTVVRLLVRLGPRAQEALPLLSRALSDSSESVRKEAVEALMTLGPPATSALISALHDESDLVRKTAAAALGEIRPPATEALSALRGLVADPSGEVRLSATKALRQIAEEAEEAGTLVSSEVPTAGEPQRPATIPAEAWALSGSIEAPFQQLIRPLAYLQITQAGGRSEAGQGSYRLLEVLSIEHCSSGATSGNDFQAGTGITTVTSVTEGLRVLDVLTADRVVAQFSVEHLEGRVRGLSFLGTRFENLRVAGQPVDLDLDYDLAEQILENRTKNRSLSLVKRIRGNFPLSKVDDNVIELLDFGKITLAQLAISPNSTKLAMIHCEFAGRLRGTLDVGSCLVNDAGVTPRQVR
jgi:uncharacterized protein (TIGR00725 family)